MTAFLLSILANLFFSWYCRCFSARRRFFNQFAFYLLIFLLFLIKLALSFLVFVVYLGQWILLSLKKMLAIFPAYCL